MLEVPIHALEYQASEPDDDELRTPYVVENLLEVSTWAHDAVALALPEKILCRPDCAGLCPECGKNLNDEPHTHEETGSRPALGRSRSAAQSRLATLVPAHGSPQEENLQVQARQAPGDALARGAAGEHLPAVPLAEARPSHLPDLRHL